MYFESHKLIKTIQYPKLSLICMKFEVINRCQQQCGFLSEAWKRRPFCEECKERVVSVQKKNYFHTMHGSLFPQCVLSWEMPFDIFVSCNLTFKFLALNENSAFQR